MRTIYDLFTIFFFTTEKTVPATGRIDFLFMKQRRARDTDAAIYLPGRSNDIHTDAAVMIAVLVISTLKSTLKGMNALEFTRRIASKRR